MPTITYTMPVTKTVDIPSHITQVVAYLTRTQKKEDREQAYNLILSIIRGDSNDEQVHIQEIQAANGIVDSIAATSKQPQILPCDNQANGQAKPFPFLKNVEQK